MIKNKRAAMEMSVGTIVTIVLLMSVLVLGIFLVQKIFKSSSGAIDTVDSQIQSQINQLFTNEDRDLVIYPSSQEITLKKGDDPKGFAFAVKNPEKERASFTYEVSSQDVSDCGSLTTDQADSWIIGKQGSFDLAPSSSNSLPPKVLFKVPKEAPACTISYKLSIQEDGGSWGQSGTVFVTIK